MSNCIDCNNCIEAKPIIFPKIKYVIYPQDDETTERLFNNDVTTKEEWEKLIEEGKVAIHPPPQKPPQS